MYYLKRIITISTLLATMNAGAELMPIDSASTSPHGNNANSNASDGVARFKPGQLVVQGVPSDYPDYEVIKILPNAGLLVLKVAPGKELAQIKRLKNESKKASLNFIVHQFATVTDSYYYPYQWNFTTIQAEQAWDISTGTGVKVAVLDTGLQQGGNDGIACVLPGIDIAYGDNDPSDGNGHGTHVSGTIAQKTNNNGTAGLSHGACILPVKVLDDSGSGTDADIAEGIAWAINNGARVINMSLGYPAEYTLGQFVGSASYNALNAASNQVTIVVASGNDGASSGVSYPASHPETIAVGATGFSNLQTFPEIAPYSNQGNDLDLVAPGGNTSQDLNGDGYGDGILQETYSSSQWGHYFFQGTSMASPHVAAAAAMLIAQDESLNRYDVLNKLTTTALDLGTEGKDSVFGHGLIQIHDALMLANPVVNQAPNAAFNFSCIDLSCDFVSTSTDTDGSIATTLWEFSDNTILSNTTVQHVFSSAGTYEITLTVTDDEGLDSLTSQTVTVTSPPVNEPPVASFSNSCVNLSCSFTSTSTDSDGLLTEYIWQLGDGTIISGINTQIDHVYATGDDFLVTLTVIDDEGAESTTSKVVVVSNPPANQLPQAAFTFVCVDLVCNFNSTSFDSDGLLTAYAWNFGDVSNSSNTSADANPQKTFLSSGTYNVTLTVFDDDNGEDTTSQMVTVDVTATVPFDFPTNVIATNNADGTATIVWTDTNTDTTGFDIQRRKQNTRKGTWGNWSVIAVTTDTQNSYHDASGKGTFEYQVRAFNNNESSSWSLSAEVTVTSSTKGGGGTKGGRSKK